ncbi:MAG: c-type cytochrome [Sphingomonadales bacterium]
MRRVRLTAFWRAVLIIAGIFVLLDNAFPPVMPISVMIQYMSVSIIGVLLYFSYDDERWAEFKAPVLALLREDRLKLPRMAMLLLVPSLAGYVTFGMVVPSTDAPVELRQVHPAPPNKLAIYGKKFDLTTLENPVRQEVLALLESEADKAREVYSSSVSAGSKIYYSNCFFCHGDLLDGDGMFAEGLSPPPANFQDVGTIAQLQEAYLFWRIATGGPGLPKEGAPWNSAMPVWHEMLGEQDIWNVIMFLYDHVGQVPRMWNQDVSRAVTALSEEVQAERRGHTGEALYQDHCAVCHGPTGAGDGPAADFLYPKPRDFTFGMFKYKTSPADGSSATDADLFKTIKHGLPGTGMPAWKTMFSDDQIRDLATVVKSFDLVGTFAPEDAEDEEFDEEGRYLGELLSVTKQVPLENQVPMSEESLARGKVMFEKTCAQCHGNEGRGNPGVGKRLKDEWGDRIWPRDLTQPWTWRSTNVAGSAEQTIQNIFTRLTTGIPGTPMPEHATNVTEEDRWHIANYAYSLRGNSVPPGKSRVVQGLKVAGDLPATVDDDAWASATPVTLRMMPNVIKAERLFKPLNAALTVRSIYNEREIALLLEFDDRTMSMPGDADAEQTQDRKRALFSDAFAIQFPKAESYSLEPTVQKPLFRHGDPAHPTTMWYWNAGSVEPRIAPFATVFDASGEDKKLAPRADDTSLKVTGEWVNGRWRVMFTRPRGGGEFGDLPFAEGVFMPISFANWDGSNGEKGSKHKLTSWYWLYLPAPDKPMMTMGLPLAVWFVTFGLGLGIVRRQRRAVEK